MKRKKVVLLTASVSEAIVSDWLAAQLQTASERRLSDTTQLSVLLSEPYGKVPSLGA